MKSISEKDQEFVWHPFTHLKYAETPINIVRTEGTYYYDENENKIIDAISSWWVNLHGHCHPYISQKVAEQLHVNEHSIFSGFTHKGAVDLAQRILTHLPHNQQRVFFSDDGSTSVEVAIKMALQYWHNKNENRKLIIAFENAYHGDTFGSMSVGARNVFNQAFSPLLFDVVHVPLPSSTEEEHYFEQFEKMIANHSVAAFIFEPLVQGAAGMLMYDEVHLNRLMAICKKHQVICIADEVMTGFGRTGHFFASNALSEQPDVMCLSKGLTGGYMPLGLTTCASFIYEAFICDEKEKTFFHGHSYTANPIACAAALASLDLMEKPETWSNIKRISEQHLSFQSFLKEYYPELTCRVKGTIIAFDIPGKEERHYLNPLADNISAYFIKKNILIRPLGNVIYLIPPYCISKDDLQYIYDTIIEYILDMRCEI